jgi:hypothetical protein
MVADHPYPQSLALLYAGIARLHALVTRYEPEALVRCVMLKQAHGHQSKRRYVAGPFRTSGDDAWMVYDDVERVVAIQLNKHEALTLAHTLNVADLRTPAIDFGGDR